MMIMVSNFKLKQMQKQTKETVSIDLSFLSIDVSGTFYHPELDTYDREGDRADFKLESINVSKEELIAYTDEIDCFYQSDLRKEYGDFQNYLETKALINLID